MTPADDMEMGEEVRAATRKAEYAELLRDPRWINLRERIVARDGRECQCCHVLGLPLNVHHLAYFDGLKPWEYPDHMLRTLCEKCHQAEHDLASTYGKSLTMAFRAMGCGNSELNRLSLLLTELRRHHPDPAGWITALATDIDDDISRCRSGKSPRPTHARH